MAHFGWPFAGGAPVVPGGDILLRTFRIDCEYEIEYENDFSNLVCVVKISACHSNLVSRVSLSADKQREGARVPGI